MKQETPASLTFWYASGDGHEEDGVRREEESQHFALDGRQDFPDDLSSGADDSLDRGTLELKKHHVMECQICAIPLGKRRLRLRHECNFCGKIICSTCSQRNFLVAGENVDLRGCTPCIASQNSAAAAERKPDGLASGPIVMEGSSFAEKLCQRLRFS